MGTQPPTPKGAEPHQFSAHVYCCQTAAWINWPRRLCVRRGPRSPSQRSPPQIFGPCLLWPNGWMDQDGTWHGGIGLGPVHIVLDGDTAPLPKKGAEPPPQFSAHLNCGQTAGCIKMPLGMEVGLSPGDFVLDGYPAPFPKRRQSPGRSPPIFGPCQL